MLLPQSVVLLAMLFITAGLVFGVIFSVLSMICQQKRQA